MFWIPIKILLKFVPKHPINNIPALVQLLAWRRHGAKPLSEQMMIYPRIFVSLGLNELNQFWTSSPNCKVRPTITFQQ